MSIQRRSDELVDLLRPDFVGNDGTASPSFVWVCVAAGTAALPGFRFCADPDTGLYSFGANELGIATLGTHRAHWNTTGAVILNDAAASTFMTGPGVTIQQGALDNEAFALQSTDVAHGMTALADTDTYCDLLKSEGASGGIFIRGFKDADGTAGGAAILAGYLGENADTTKTTAGRAITEIHGFIKSGATIGNTNADGNVFAVRTRRGGAEVTLLIVDAEADVFVLGGLNVGTATGAAAGELHLSGAINMFWAETQTPLTLTAGGVVTVGTGTFYRLDTFGGAAAQDLVTINGAQGDGHILILAAVNAARDVTVTDAGNKNLVGDWITTNLTRRLVIMWDAGISRWVELCRT